MSEQPGRTAPPTAGAGGFLARIAARAEGVSEPGRLRPRPVSRFERLREDGGAAPDGSPGGADQYPDPAPPWSARPAGAARWPAAPPAPTGPPAGRPDQTAGSEGARLRGAPAGEAAGTGPSADLGWPRSTSARPTPTRKSSARTGPAGPAEEPSAAAWQGLAAAAGAAPDGAFAPSGPGQAPPTAEGRPATGPAADRAERDALAAPDGLTDPDGAWFPPRPAGDRSVLPEEPSPIADFADSTEPLDGVGRSEWPMPQTRRGRPSAPAPVVHVTIGRVEVRAVPAGPTGPERVRSEEPAVTTLDQYLRRRARERG
ncbi:hypothetical protein ACGFZP_33215 [Kitasatospora sp. NPDC048239]|uniref:hypothetical protein n=1 Tax=Kitasatospora sp. NPDC048239 TaxID=3364046 RepID=UPI003711EADD